MDKVYSLYVYLIYQWGGYGPHVVGVIWDDEDGARALALNEKHGADSLLFSMQVPGFPDRTGVVFSAGHFE